MNKQVTVLRNSTGGWTVRWPAENDPGYFRERHFTPAIGYRCRGEALAFAKELRSRKNEERN